MKNSSKRLAMVAVGLMMAGIAQAGDMDSAVAYSLGEFDRVGVSQPAAKAQQGERAKAQGKSVAGNAQSAQDRQLAAHKAEFLRRMFWLALVAR